MPQYSTASKKRRAECDPRLQGVLDELVRLMDCSILCGHRGKEEQDLAFAQKRSKLPWPKSKHNPMPSLAVDVAPFYREGASIRWPNGEILRNPEAQVFARYAYMIGLARGIASQRGLRLRSGLDWDSDGEIADNSFMDLPHLEIDDG